MGPTKDSSLIEWAEWLIEKHWRQDGVIGEIALVPGAVMDDFQTVVEGERGTALCRCGHPANKHSDAGCLHFSVTSCSCMGFRSAVAS